MQLAGTLRKIASKNKVAASGSTLEPLIDKLVKAGVFTSVKAKRVKALSGIRNKALHALWDEFDHNDAKSLTEGTRELIDTHLADGA
jgi:phosphoserine phosphatase